MEPPFLYPVVPAVFRPKSRPRRAMHGSPQSIPNPLIGSQMACFRGGGGSRTQRTAT